MQFYCYYCSNESVKMSYHKSDFLSVVQSVFKLKLIQGCMATLLTLVGIATATAHAVLDRSLITPGQSINLSLAIEHGCNGSATTALRLQLPDGLLVETANNAEGFRAETVKARFERSWTGPQGPVTEGVKEIIWSGGNLPNKTRGEFSFAIHVSADLKATGSLALPVIQTCASGENRWIEFADTQSGRDMLKSPAPVLMLVKPEQAHLDIRNGRSRVTPNGAPVAGGYVTIRNFSNKADRLIAASLPLAMHTEIHEMSMMDGIMRMRALDKGLEIPAGGTVELKQGSYHLMFIKPSRAFTEGEWIEGTLTFERAGTLPVRFKVEAVGGHTHQSGTGQGHHAH
jgi:copper(I)-binding protein